MADTLSAAVPTTAAAVKRGALYPAMDVIAAGIEKDHLIHRPDTPEADSLVELLVMADDVIHKLGDLVVRLAGINGDQVEFGRNAAGFADRLVTALRDHELNYGGAQTMSGRRLAHQLIPLVDGLEDMARLEEHPQLRKGLHEIFASVPVDLIFRDAVYDHLGVRRRPKLEREHTLWKQRRSAQARKGRRS